MSRVAAALAACLTLSACNAGLERMQEQPRGDAYEPTSAFPNGSVMQHPPRATVAREGDDASRPAVSMALVELGQRRYDIFCAACHGIAGNGHSPVARRMALRGPPSLVRGSVAGRPGAYLYRVISEGYGLMPSYAAQLRPRERWAVVAYVRALQVSQAAALDELPPDVRAEVRRALEGNAR